VGSRPGDDRLLAAVSDPTTLAESSERSPNQARLRREVDDAARLLDFPTPFHVYRHLNGLLRHLQDELHLCGIDSSA